MGFSHIPVLFNESVDNLKIVSGGTYVDCTLGGAGHSLEIAKRVGEKGLLIGIDQDADAIVAAKSRLSPYSDRIRIVKSNFVNIDKILDELCIQRIDGALMDIGVSSYQFDEQERGFSYRMDAELDMRMDRSRELTAFQLVNERSQQELEDIFWRYGEEKWGRRIAQFIIEERAKTPILTTFQLVEVIQNAIPKKARSEGGHPAKRVFQALRIAVNSELDVLTATIPKLVDRLNPGGRLCVITFHSLEDRIVKNLFKEMSTGCVCPSDFPVCVCNHVSSIKNITRKPITAGDFELQHNPRSSSAKLRVAEKI